jgi:hypothetical protein
VLLTETVRAAGLDRALSVALERWRKPTAVHYLGDEQHRPMHDARTDSSFSHTGAPSPH